MLAHIKNITQDGEEETKIEDSEEEDDIPLVSRGHKNKSDTVYMLIVAQSFFAQLHLLKILHSESSKHNITVTGGYLEVNDTFQFTQA